jgi:hypothetical protein
MNQFALIVIILWLGIPSAFGWLIYHTWDRDENE